MDEATKTNFAIQGSAIHGNGGTGNDSLLPPAAKLLRPTPGGSPGVLLLFGRLMRDGLGNVIEQDHPFVRWVPQDRGASARVLPDPLPTAVFNSYSLLQTTSQAALLHFQEPETNEYSTLLVDLGTRKTRVFPRQLLTGQYVLLEPKFLYNFTDTRFHTLDATPRPTALPRRLADVPPVPPESPIPPIRPREAAYHVIRLP